MNLIFVALVAVFVSGSQGIVAPSFIHKCPGLKKECLKPAIQDAIPHFTKGIPELGIMTTDPLKDDNVKLELPGAFKVQLKNGTLTGLRKCIVEDVNFQQSIGEADLKLRCNVTIRGHYKAKGNILIVSINGDGDAKIIIRNAEISGKIKFEDKVRDNVLYYEIKDLKVTHKYGDKITFSLTNLFKGSPQLSEAVLTFLNENWLQIAEEFGGPIIDRLVKIIFNTVKIFFEKIPKHELIEL